LAYREFICAFQLDVDNGALCAQKQGVSEIVKTSKNQNTNKFTKCQYAGTWSVKTVERERMRETKMKMNEWETMM
jgi:hypothetical protein